MDFRNTIIILTSNLGSEFLAALPEGGRARDVQGKVMEVVRAAFRPEFLNRLDEIVLFDRLSRGHMDGIVRIQLGHLERRLEPRKITLDLSDAARTWLADKGYDPVYGARPLKRVIQKAIQDPLAELLLAGTIKDGETVHIGADSEGLIIGDRARGATQDASATVH